MFKEALAGAVWLGSEGLAGDAQADRRVHGGPEKALHQYPVGHYATLARAFPDAAQALVPGAMGENLSASGWDEGTVAIGDIFRLGQAVIQVSQPRSPCWKIDHRFNTDGMARLIAEARIPGWYFRVLEPGEVGPGALFERIGRNSAPLTVAELLALWAEHRPGADQLDQASRSPGLSAPWAAKLRDRASRLRGLPG